MLAATAMMFRALVTALLLASIATTGSARPIGALMTSDDIRAQLVGIQHRHVDSLHPDVMAVDVNHKTMGREPTDWLSVVVKPKGRLPRDIEDEDDDDQVCVAIGNAC